MRRGHTGAETRDAIRTAAIAEFRHQGYRGASLEAIAGTLGITRAAVLHHYGTKAELLAAVLDPYLDAVEAVIDRYEGPLAGPQRNRFLVEMIDAFIAHHDVAGILIRDVTAHADQEAARRADELHRRFAAVLAGPHPSADDSVVAASILGAVLRPLTDPGLRPTDPATRRMLLRLACQLADQITGPVASLGRVGVA